MRKYSLLNSRWRLSLFAVLLVLSLFSARSVYAREADVTIFSITQQDLNGDDRPDLTTINCRFATDHDRLYIVDTGHNMRASTNWRDATDFTDDVWLYDINADGSIQLIVVYKIEEGHTTAYVYDDRDGDGQVKFERIGTFVRILESPYWTGRIISNSNWFLPDGRLNLNVHMQLDGPIPTLDRAPLYYIRDYMKHDGVADVEFEEVAGSDGIARYALRRLIAPSPADWEFERAWLWSNEGYDPTSLSEQAFFPFLPIPISPQDPRYVNLRYFDLPPNISVDWLKGKIFAVKLDGYPIGYGYHFNDNDSIVKGKVNDVSFESPQAYYDLANDHDGFADLHIRFFTRPPNDPRMWYLPNTDDIPWQSISYDWNLFNPEALRWDFKIGVAGNQEINSVVHFPDFAVRTVPFKELPYWVTNHEWKLTTFVAREGDGYESAEGIYEWQTDTGDDPEMKPERALEARDATFGYMLGVTDHPPTEYFQTTRLGFRAERHFAGSIRPYLYFSPLDHKLHLQGAEDGIWTIDDTHLIRYDNLNDDAYLDRWSYFENSRLKREFYWAGTYLIYAGENGVWLKRAKVPPSLFETVPPRNHEEWLAQRQMLNTDPPDFAPEDFKAMLKQFPGLDWQLEGAAIRDFRLEGKGFRFVLELQPGFRVTGNGGPDLDDLSSGTYVVNYQNSFIIEPVSPAKPLVALLPVALTQWQLNSLPIKIWNDGLEDLPLATLELWATSPNGTTSIVADQTVELLAQKSSTVQVMWAPPSSGGWVLTPKIRQSDGRLTSGNPVSIMVAGSANENPFNAVFASASPRRLPVILLGLIILASLTALVFWRSEWGQPLTKIGEDDAKHINPKRNEIKNRCPNCEAQEKQSKAGFNRSGSQRHQCGQCKRVYTPNPKFNGYPAETRMLAIRMYMDGKGFNAIGRALKVSPQTVVRWVKQYIANSSAAPAPRSQSIAELDKSYSFMDYELKSTS